MQTWLIVLTTVPVKVDRTGSLAVASQIANALEQAIDGYTHG